MVEIKDTIESIYDENQSENFLLDWEEIEKNLYKFIAKNDKKFKAFYGEDFVKGLISSLEDDFYFFSQNDKNPIKEAFTALTEAFEKDVEEQEREKIEKEEYEHFKNVIETFKQKTLPSLAEKYGISYTSENSGLSDSFYVTFILNGHNVVVRFSDHDLPPTYRREHGDPDIEVNVGDKKGKYLEWDYTLDTFVDRFQKILESTF